jgi:hypothetical protein
LNKSRIQAALWFVKSPLAVVILGPLALFTPVILSGQALFWGLPSLQFNPWQAYALEQLKQGMLPLWNPLSGMGAPLLANYQLAFFYPPTWLAYLFGWIGGLPAMAWSQSLILAGHLIFAGSGMVFFTRSLGLGTLAQAVAGLCFGLGGSLVARNGFFSMIWAAAWLPWLLFLGGSIARGIWDFKFRNLALLSICVAMQLLAGHAQLTWYSLLLTSLWILFCALQNGGMRRAGLICLRWGGCVLGGIALAAVQLLPTLEYLQQSQRSSAVGFESGLTYSFWPWRLLSFFSPDFFGNPGAGNFTGYGSYWEDAVYFGVAGIFFAVSTLAIVFRKKNQPTIGGMPIRPTIVFFWASAAVGLIFALGKNTPIFLFLYQFVPTFNLFNGPARWIIWTAFSLCVLAAVGVEVFISSGFHQKRRWRLASVICFAIALGAGAAWVMLREIQISFIRATATAGILAFAFTLLAERAPMPGKKSNWPGFLIIFILADLLLAGSGLIPALPASFYDIEKQANPIPAGLSPGSRVYLSANDEYFIKFSRFFRFEDYNPIENWAHIYSALLPNLNLVWKIPSANNFDPFVPRRFSEWMKQVELADPEAQRIMLKGMNVGAIEKIDPDSTLGVRYELMDPLPRFRFVKCGDAMAESGGAKAFIQAGGTVITDHQMVRFCADEAGGATVTLVVDSPQKTILHVNSQFAGWLVAADTFYPGWKAMIDGAEMEINPANELFRAVEISAGTHQIQFVYAPVSFNAGAMISACAWLLLMWIFIFKK